LLFQLRDLANTYNPYIEGWINYYGQFYRTHLRPTLKRIDVYAIRWSGGPEIRTEQRCTAPPVNCRHMRQAPAAIMAASSSSV
jgi:hypothetical protein